LSEMPLESVADRAEGDDDDAICSTRCVAMVNEMAHERTLTPEKINNSNSNINNNKGLTGGGWVLTVKEGRMQSQCVCASSLVRLFFVCFFGLSYEPSKKTAHTLGWDFAPSLLSTFFAAIMKLSLSLSLSSTHENHFKKVRRSFSEASFSMTVAAVLLMSSRESWLMLSMVSQA
jgi:hypothetical protein